MTRIATVLLLSMMAATRALGACVPPSCDDNNLCTVDFCDPLLNSCIHRPAAPCNDNNVCTTDTCNPATGCVQTPIPPCNDNNACTVDTCNPASGCTFSPIAPCNDNNVCTTDTCNPATGCTQTPINCADNVACTTDVCDSVTGCRHILNVRCFIVQNLFFRLSNPLVTTSFKRIGGSKSGVDFVKVSFQNLVLDSIDGKLVRHKVKVNAEITGADAGLGSLLYPVAALGMGNGALGAIKALGYDVSINGTLAPCQDQLPTGTCSDLARQLSRAIDAAFGPGDDPDRTQFRGAAGALGFPPETCCTPTTCAAQSANCGSIADGCGGMLDCGTCTPPASCGGAGVSNQCGVIF